MFFLIEDFMKLNLRHFIVAGTLSTFTIFLATELNTAALPTNSPVVPGAYRVGPSGGYYPETNVNELWPGVWKQSTNGMRVQLYCRDTNRLDFSVAISVGSVTTNSPERYYSPPIGQFWQFQLRDTNGNILSPKNPQFIGSEPPLKIEDRDIAKWHDGERKGLFGFLSNAPPVTLQDFKIYDLYRIPREGDYILLGCPAVYRFEKERQDWVRIGLPCVSVSIHLWPSEL
jgi:hypothetical protein